MIKNQELAKQILEMMDTAIEASNQLSTFLENAKMAEFKEVSEGLFLMIKSIRDIADNLKKEEDGINLPAASESALVSLDRIQNMAYTDVNRARKKIEFELIPLIEEMRVVFYYWGMVYPDPVKMKKYYEEDIFWLAENKYQAEAAKTGNYKYELSIIILAYNKLDYTKQCIVSLLKNLPKGISYEIILFNHGSTDGTKEFFESLHPHKQVDIAVNGGGLELLYRITEGKYILTISNDVLVQKNSIKNLYECIDSDERIAWVVPSTPNVSNFQMIPANYSTIEELEKFAESNNVDDRTKWEQRVRLCNPIEIIRGEFLQKCKPAYYFQSRNRWSFPDDKCSLLCRRNGYKMYLVKNAFCHHFGSITLREDKKTNAEDAFLKGRRDFFQMFGVDPWSTGVCYSLELFHSLKCIGQGNITILGVNCGMGSNSLKIKEKLKETSANYSVFLKNITTDSAVLADLAGISDEAEYLLDYHEMEYWKETFDYIIAEDIIMTFENVINEIELFTKRCKSGGTLILAVKASARQRIEEERVIVSAYQNVEFINDSNGYIWLVMNKK